MEKKEEVKINFLKKIWYSITNFEQYPTMAIEGVGRAIKYLILLTAIISIFVTFCSYLDIKNTVQDLSRYIQDNIPEFSYSNGSIFMDTQDAIVIEDVENTGMDKILINTAIKTDEEKAQFEKDNSLNGSIAYFFNDEIVLKIQMENEEIARQKYTYADIITILTGNNIESSNKTELVQYLSSNKMTTFYNTFTISMYVYYFIENFILVLVYSLEIALLGWITTIILRIKMRFKALYNMSAYSITLPTILMTIYIVVNYFTGFTIKEFQIAYIAISYIYLAAAIFILKDDFMKRMQEVEKIKQEQLKVREEIKEEQEKKEDKDEDKKEEKEDNNKDDEPQGSEA